MKVRQWENNNAKTITFVVTKDCQLACKYCYLVGKNKSERMSLDTAKEAVDFIISQRGDPEFSSDSVIFDFIGGEPLLEIDLIDELCDYIKRRLYETDHPWFNLYRFSISTNGINYHTPKVQKFIAKNIKHLSIGVSLDGTKTKHDLNRIWNIDGIEKGSYDSVVANVPLWLQQFPYAATKVTVSSDDIPYICESVLHLFSLGIHQVNINCVFEDVWKDGDDVVFEDQLRKLAKKMVEQNLYEDYDCSFFDRSIGKPLDLKYDNNNWCGCGHMLAIDPHGLFYPCNRFLDFALTKKKPRIIGAIGTGIDRNRLRPFVNLDRITQSPLGCLDCSVASGCAWCQAENYDSADADTIYIRSVAICRMHKARVRANEYYWSLIDGQKDDSGGSSTRSLQVKIDKNSIKQGTYLPLSDVNSIIVMLQSDMPAICGYVTGNMQPDVLSKDNLESFFNKYFGKTEITVVYPPYELPADVIEILSKYPHNRIISRDGRCSVYSCSTNEGYTIIPLSFHDFYKGVDCLFTLLNSSRLNIMLYDYSGFDEGKYEIALSKLKEKVLECWKAGHKVRVNIVTDPLGLPKLKECSFGRTSLFLAPDGYFYLCPAFYYDRNKRLRIGDLTNGWKIPAHHLLFREYSPVCRKCNKRACMRCIYENKKGTLEYNTPSYEQCKRAEIEERICLNFFRELEQ